MGIKNLKIFVLYVAGLFLCVHNFIPHNHAEVSEIVSSHYHHGDAQHGDVQHDHEIPAADDESEASDPLELPDHQENVAKYIIKHHSEQIVFAPDLLIYIAGVYAINQPDPLTLSYLPNTRSYRLRWDCLLISSSYLRGPPSLILS